MNRLKNKIMACTHDTVFGGLCVVCGADVSRARLAEPRVSVGTIHPRLTVSAEHAQTFMPTVTQAMLDRRKLLLVLDLDHTLICAEQGTFKRPHVDEFLAGCAQLFDLVLYTLGRELHARRSLAILDADGTLFCGRVISTEALVNHNKRLDLLLQDESVCIILDDCPEVWPRHRRSVMKCAAYWGDPTANKKYLLGCLHFLRALHADFFARAERPDIRDLLAEHMVALRAAQARANAKAKAAPDN